MPPNTNEPFNPPQPVNPPVPPAFPAAPAPAPTPPAPAPAPGNFSAPQPPQAPPAQQQPYYGAQPTGPAQGGYQQPYQQQQVTSNTLGIVSIVLAFFAPLIGLIVGIIGLKKAKTAPGGNLKQLSTIGVILSVVFMLISLLILTPIVIATFSGVKEASKAANSNEPIITTPTGTDSTINNSDSALNGSTQ